MLRESNHHKSLTAALLILIVILSTLIGVSVRHGVSLDTLNASASAKRTTVILDAGHGGEDCGAIGKSGVFEKDLNFDITMQMGSLLSGYGYNVVYTRTEDKLLYRPEENIKGIRKISDLKNRCAIANGYTDAIFVSIHMNSFGDSRYSGLQVYYSESISDSRMLAEAIQSSVRKTLQPQNNRRIKSGDGIYLLENITMPSVLVECGFLSNVEECEKLSQKEYQKELSFSIVCGIIEYIEAIHS